MEHYPFKLHSNFEPQGDQPEAIKEIVKGVNEGNVIKHYLVRRELVRHLR